MEFALAKHMESLFERSRVMTKAQAA